MLTSLRLPLSTTLLTAVAALGAVAGCAGTSTEAESRASAPAADARIATVEAFRAARAAGDLELARAYLSEDPRTWYDQKQGQGSPLKLGAGRWHDWDEHFHGSSEQVGDWHVAEDSIWAEFYETNDYFRLTERGGGYWRSTYFFAPDGRLCGSLVSASPERERPAGRADEFEAWARAEHPEEAEYLMPAGKIDPSGDRAPRMRALLEAWHSAIPQKSTPSDREGR